MALISPLRLTSPRKKFSSVDARRNRRPSSLASLDLLQPINGAARLRVAYQGIPGAYSEFAAKSACPNCTTVPCQTFIDMFAAVRSGRADRAVLPVESTLGGNVVRNYQLLLQHDLQIVQEIRVFLHYCLLAMPGVRKRELKKVISHPMALAHCDRALAQLGLDQQPVEDTAGAVEMLRLHRMLDTAAIASPRAAVLYGLDVLAHGLQNESWNVTRFLVLSRRHESPKNQCGVKTSVVIAHRGGSQTVLLRVLSVFSTHNINLMKLEVNNTTMEGAGPVMILDVHGRGSLKAFSHIIYADFEGSVGHEKVKDAIAEIADFAVLVRILGSYPEDPNIYDLR